MKWPQTDEQINRFIAMIFLNILFGVMAIAAAVGTFVMGIEPMIFAFVGAIAGAFGVQLWFIAGVRRAKKGG
jgi:hypothetical protein